MALFYGGDMGYARIFFLVALFIGLTTVLAFAKDRKDDYRKVASMAAKERAENLLNRGEYQKAHSLLKEALQADSSNPDLYALLGDTWIGLEDRGKALEAYTQAIHYNCRQASVFFVCGSLHAERKAWADAITDYTKSIQIDPEPPLSYYGRGCAYLELRQYAKARADYERAWKRGLESPTAYALAKLLAMCPETTIRDGRLAIKYAKKACEQTEFKDAVHLGVLAAAHAEAGEWDEAINQGEKSARLAQGAFRELLSMCVELYRFHEPYHEGCTRTPIASSQAAIRPNPRSADVHYRLGGALLFQDTDSALGHYTRCTELDPKSPDAFARRAEAHIFLGKWQEAMADAKAALVLNPKHLNARLTFASCLASLGEPNRALHELKELNDEFPDHESVHLVRGKCYVVQKRFEDAVSELTEAIRRIPQCALGYAERAVAFSALRKVDEAKQDLKECARLAPFLSEATETRIKAMNKKPLRP